ncbi:GtrA family protein [Novosphingobium sp. 9]|uniref:GtrA family protein n=1 Tax=Novosphingobium sp. 9 TaxID=2025349 RepID=UPI0021B6BF05|nr:GtrA family protein [Novosphingobium sp. 9]
MTVSSWRILRAGYFRYVIISVGALAVDTASFLALLWLTIPSTVAGAIGYLAGLLGHWIGSSQVVFKDRLAPRGEKRRRQRLGFAGSALVGLGITVGTIWACTQAGWDPRTAKLLAIALSFQATWWLRKHVVFRPMTNTI